MRWNCPLPPALMGELEVTVDLGAGNIGMVKIKAVQPDMTDITRGTMLKKSAAISQAALPSAAKACRRSAAIMLASPAQPRVGIYGPRG